MKIAIIGSGWVGCHLASHLNHDITIYEKDQFFSKSSAYNQNRLHLGFHYCRNEATRNLCLNTFNKFLADYGHMVEDVENNLYAIPLHHSLLDFPTYLKIFDKNLYEIATVPELKGIEGCIKVNEKLINAEKARQLFYEKLSPLVVYKEIDKDYDWIINCTNNMLNPQGNNYFYELCITLLYEKIKSVSFGAITLVDGKFFSIYPYQDDLYSVTDVEYTPVRRMTEIGNYEVSVSEANNIKDKIEEKVLRYFPSFGDCFRYQGYFTSYKSKVLSESANRFPVFNQQGNVINCFTGKIQGIYIIQEYVNEIINK